MRYAWTWWTWRVAAFLGFLWVVGLTLMAPTALQGSDSGGRRAQLSARLQRAMFDLDQLKRQNGDMKKILTEFAGHVKQLNPSSPSAVDDDGALEKLKLKLDNAQKVLAESEAAEGDHGGSDIIPSFEFEQRRRLVERDLRESWYFVRSRLTGMVKEFEKPGAQASAVVNLAKEILKGSGDRIRLAQHDLGVLSDSDGLGKWRAAESHRLSQLVQNRLHKLQHPKNCAHARKLLCNLNKGCGYGCQIHHAVYCMIVAYGTNRTLILKSRNWRYDRQGFEHVFKPVSETCVDHAGQTYAYWPGTDSTQVVEIPIIDTLSQRPPYLPLAIPEDLSKDLMRFHGSPFAWWAGQFLKYLLRPQPETEEMLKTMEKELDFQGPIVGVHIRRTDKVGTEAAFHPVEEYMAHADEFFDRLALEDSNVVRRVYVASDEPKVIDEIREKFPSYRVHGDPNISRTAAVATRYSQSSLKGIIADIHFLAKSDFLVCTFSSQVCRIAYEIMQTLLVDGAARFRSLDDIYYYGGQNAHNQKTRFAHEPASTDEMSLQRGDIIGVAGNHWNGLSKGVNRHSRRNALYPSHKVEEVVDIAPMPVYKEADANLGLL